MYTECTFKIGNCSTISVKRSQLSLFPPSLSLHPTPHSRLHGEYVIPFELLICLLETFLVYLTDFRIKLFVVKFRNAIHPKNKKSKAN